MVPMAHDLHLGRLEASFAMGLSLLMTALGGLLFGFIGDRYGRRPTIIATVLIYGFGTLLCAASLNLTHLLIFRSLTGIGIGGEWAAGQSLVAETVPPDRRARYAAYVQPRSSAARIVTHRESSIGPDPSVCARCPQRGPAAWFRRRSGDGFRRATSGSAGWAVAASG